MRLVNTRQVDFAVDLVCAIVKHNIIEDFAAETVVEGLADEDSGGLVGLFMADDLGE